MKKIESLTKEQEAKVQLYIKKWMDNGYSIENIPNDKRIEAIKTIYKCAKYDEPKYFFFFPSPLQCQLAVNILKNSDLEIKKLLNKKDNLGANLGDNLGANLRDNLGANLRDNLWDNLGANLRDNLWDNLWDNLGANLRDNLWDNLGDNLRDNLKTEFLPMYYGNFEWDIGWIGFYDFILNELFEERISEFKSFIEYIGAMKQIHAFIPYKDIVFISDRPVEINLNTKGKLHADLKSALMYKDGYSLFYLNGIRTPKYIIETEGSKLDTLKVIGEKNVDVRREGLRKIPMDKLIKDTKAKVLDEWKDYKLLLMDFNDGKIRKVLQMKNPSIDAQHFERVEDNIETCRGALAWRNGMDKFFEPKILT